jgi:ribosomal 50S subunit-associated protein YjgA (DUF615 family)
MTIGGILINRIPDTEEMEPAITELTKLLLKLKANRARHRAASYIASIIEAEMAETLGVK